VKSRFVIVLVALALVTSASPELFGQKTKKIKEKRFEVVVRQNLKDYEGTYTGIEPDYVIEIRATADGKLEINSLEDGLSVTLTNVKVTGARVIADKLYANGRRGKFDATFSNRILNGVSAFGILVDGLDVHLDGGVVLNRLFYRRN
jgi:hypothetical protein